MQAEWPLEDPLAAGPATASFVLDKTAFSDCTCCHQNNIFEGVGKRKKR